METVTIDRSKTWTATDYEQLEEGLLAQLIDGELIMSPAPTTRHQRILRQLYDILSVLKFQNGELFFSPIDVYLDAKHVFQPDLIFIPAIDKQLISLRGIEGAPALVVEIVSPSNSFLDRNIKKRKYLQFGVKEYWIVDPGNKTLEIYIDNEDIPFLYLVEKGKVTSPLLGSKDFELAGVFEE